MINIIKILIIIELQNLQHKHTTILSVYLIMFLLSSIPTAPVYMSNGWHNFVGGKRKCRRESKGLFRGLFSQNNVTTT